MICCAQVQTHADTAFFQGLIDEQQRMTALAMQLSIGQAIALGGCCYTPMHFV